MHPLSDKIAELRRQTMWRCRATALCWSAVIAISAALLLGLIDYIVRFNDSGLRIVLTATFACAMALVAYHLWILPRRKHLTQLNIAQRVQSRFPQLQDSLASAIEFLQHSEHDKTAGSEQLRRQVIAKVHSDIQMLPLADVIDRGPLRMATIWLAIMIAAVAVCLSINPQAVRTGIVRLAAPLGGTQWPRHHHLVFRTVPSQLAAGQALDLELIDTTNTLPDDVILEFAVDRAGERSISSEPMKRAGDVMIARREDVAQSFVFRAKGGDDDTMPWHSVEVKQLPQLTAMSIIAHPPAYTGLPILAAERHLSVIAGTGIEVNGTTKEPIHAARIIQDGGKSISAAIVAGSDGNKARAFHLESSQWIATHSGAYRLELTSETDLAGVVGQWNLNVEPDMAPTITWQRPMDELYVLPTAVVPIEVVAKDDLAIKSVDLHFECSEKSERAGAVQLNESPISLYRSSDSRPVSPPTTNRPPGDNRSIEYSWALEPLKLSAGNVLTIEAEATDYQPRSSRTLAPRRISIITADQLQNRLAERQAEIARRIDRALSIERKVRADVSRLEVQLHDTGTLSQSDRLVVKSAEPNQKSVVRLLIDPAEGVLPLVAAILHENEINHCGQSVLVDAVIRVPIVLQQLATEPLSNAEAGLTSARKIVESVTPATNSVDEFPLPLAPTQVNMLIKNLDSAGTNQDDVITALDRLAKELSGNAEIHRIVSQLTQLHEEQVAHKKKSQVEIGRYSLALDTSELSKAQWAILNKAAAGQSQLATQLAKIELRMEQLARQLTGGSAAKASMLKDALALLRQRSIVPGMRRIATAYSENQVNQALDLEHKIDDDLQQVLDMLRNEGERRPQALADRLKLAEQNLIVLQRRLAQLRRQLALNEETENNLNAEQRRALDGKQQSIRRDIEQSSRELSHLAADDASRSTQAAANSLSDRQSEDRKRDESTARLSPGDQVKQAEQDLERAKNQLTRRREQAEDDLQLEIVRRFQNQLGDMVERQQAALNSTTRLDAAREPQSTLSPSQVKIVINLARQEHHLADQVREHSELLFGLGAVRVSLEEAEKWLLTAATSLEKQQTSFVTQQAEQLALKRLKAMLHTFAETATEAGKRPDPASVPPPPTANSQRQPPRRPTFELLEIKMLRTLQADLNVRTVAHENRVASETDAANKVVLEQEARELAAEQGQLVEVVEKMLLRDNEQQQ